jgi:cyanate lyase-like protein
MPPTDPLIYRFYELVMINGPALKVLIEEEFGDGVMSAIDFDLAMDSPAQPERRPGENLDVWEIPAVQILRRLATCRSTGTGRNRPRHAPVSAASRPRRGGMSRR